LPLLQKTAETKQKIPVRKKEKFAIGYNETQYSGRGIVTYMAKRRLTILAAILVLLSLTLAVIYHLAKANYYTASDVFWYGAIAGVLGCLVLAFLVLICFLSYRLALK